MKRYPLLQTVLTALAIIGITTLLYLYTSGYRVNKGPKNNITINKTGMVSAKSNPEGATVYLDGKLLTATNDTIAGIAPGAHKLKIVKKGFVEWQKEIEVFEELVTDITAVLVSQSPRLEPLTNTGAKIPTLSNSQDKLAFTTSGEEKSGIWIMQVGGSALNIFRPNASVALQDTKTTKYSQAKSLEWSYDDKKLLIEGSTGVFYMADLEKGTSETTSSPNLARKDWAEKTAQKRSDFISKIEIPQDKKQLALSAKSIWSPDQKKFLYTAQSGSELEYRVVNLEKPLPVGEKTETLVFKTNAADPQPALTWYPDSYHFVMVEGKPDTEKKGIVNIIRIDGTNKTEIYNNTLYSGLIFSVPNGDRLIMLTSFNSRGQTDLYAVSIR